MAFLSREKVEQFNRLLLERLSEYMNLYADFVTPDMLESTVRDCGVSEEDAFRILVSGALDLYENRDIMNYYLRSMFRQLDAAEYRSDKYYETIKPESAKVGSWSLESGTLKPYEAFVYNDIMRMPDGRLIPQIGFFREEYTYPCVKQGGREWMTVTPNEIETMKKPISEAHGDVLTYGLGMGYFAFHALLKAQVKSVTVIESDAESIALFKSSMLPFFTRGDSIKIIYGDAYEYAGHAGSFDYIFADIWHDPSDGVEAYLKLKSLELPGIKYSYWIEDTLKCYIG